MIKKINVDKLINMNFIFWSIITLYIALFKRNSVMTNLIIPVLGIYGMYLIYKNNSFGYLVFGMQTLFYGALAIRYSLVGEYYSNTVLFFLGNLILYLRHVLINLRLIARKPKKKYKEKIFLFTILRYVIFIFIFVILNDYLDSAGSLFPELESINAILLVIGLYKAWNNRTEAYVYWLSKGVVSLYIWVKIENRLFPIIFFLFYIVHSILILADKKKKLME